MNFAESEPAVPHDSQGIRDGSAGRSTATVRDDQRQFPPTVGKRVNRVIAAWSRWLHIYMSMFGLATVLFFSVTGLTLNHPDWFFDETTTQLNGSVAVKLVNSGASPPADWDEYDYSFAVSKLAVAEHLRAKHRLSGSVTDFLAFEDECEVTFQGPGYAATARIARATGAYTVDVTANDLVSVLNDLHKGRHTGKAWSAVIDVSAILSALIAASGFLLIFYLRLRRFTGLLTGGAGVVVLAVMYFVATS